MSTLQIKTPYPQQATPLIKKALEMERKLTRDSLASTQERISRLSQDLHVDINEVLAGHLPRHENNEMLLLELEGELELQRILEEALRSLDSIEVCE